LIERGLTRNEIDNRVATGRLHHLHRGVYAGGHRVLTAEGRWLAATLATGGVLSHATAAAAWEMLPTTSGLIHVTVAVAAGRERRTGIRIHRSATLESRDATTHRGIPITTPIRTVLDVAPRLNGRRLDAARPPGAAHQFRRIARTARSPPDPSGRTRLTSGAVPLHGREHRHSQRTRGDVPAPVR
jgi:hypothetical protein